MSMFNAFKPLIEYEAGRAIYQRMKQLRKKIEEKDNE